MASTARNLTFVSVAGVQDSNLERVYRDLCGKTGPGRVLVGYAFGRQVNEWLAGVHRTCLQRLAEHGRTRWYGVDGNYSIHYIPNRMFEMKRIEPKGPTVRVYDIHHWFDTTFEGACQRYACNCPPEYWGRDLAVDGNLAGCLCAHLDELGLRPTQWYGPGAVAAKLMRQHRVAEHNPPQAPAMEKLFRHAYYGGRIQALQVGEMGPARRYDLRSAYASAMVDLPSLDAEWFRWTDGLLRHTGVYLVSWHTPHGETLTPFPWRDDAGHIHYPREGQGWYWGSLIDAALDGPWGIDFHDGYCFWPRARERPFAYLGDLHAQRQQLRGTVKADLLKAVMVSSYGKLAQQGGSGASRTRSLAWAGMVTAQVQAWLLEAALKAPDRVCHFLTDGLLLRGQEEIGLPLGTDLGQWDTETYDGLWCFQPAMYVARHGEDEELALHAAGSSGGWKQAADAVIAWEEDGLAGRVSFNDRVYCGLAMARLRGWDKWRTWADLEREMVLHPALGFPGAVGEDVNRFIWEAWRPGEDYSVCSHPYAPRGEGLVDGRWAEVEAIRAAGECAG